MLCLFIKKAMLVKCKRAKFKRNCLSLNDEEQFCSNSLRDFKISGSLCSTLKF